MSTQSNTLKAPSLLVTGFLAICPVAAVSATIAVCQAGHSGAWPLFAWLVAILAVLFPSSFSVSGFILDDWHEYASQSLQQKGLSSTTAALLHWPTLLTTAAAPAFVVFLLSYAASLVIAWPYLTIPQTW